MGEMIKFKLGECIEEIVDKTTVNNQYEVLSVTKDGIFSQERFFKKQIASKDNTGYKIIRKNNLVFSTMNLWMGSLDVLTNYEIGIVSPAYKVFRFNMDKINPAYGKYFMKSHFMLEQYKICSEQGASIVRRNLNLEQLLETKILLPPLEAQKKIVTILDTVSSIIEKYDKLILEYQQLIKSQFVEMFENKNFKEKTLNEISIIKGEYGSGASAGEFVEGQPRYVRITDIQEDGRLDKQSLASPRNENNIDKYILKYGDILFARTGATVGKTYKYNENDGYCIYAGYCIRFRLDLQLCNPDYIFTFTKTEKYKKWVENKQRAVAQPNINAKEYGNDLKIPVPPIALQNQFADFVQQVDKQKFELEKQKENYVNLKKGLMQQLLTGKIEINI